MRDGRRGPSFSGLGLFPSDACPTLHTGTVPRERCRCQPFTTAGGQVGQLPRSQPPAVDPEVDPDDGIHAANLRLPSLFLGWETRGTHHECV